MIVCFTLTMPGVASWNGRWSGEGSLYAVCRTFRETPKCLAQLQPLLTKKFFSYSFSDGWRACVEVSLVGRNEATHVRKHSRGFNGYDWMIDSLLQIGDIRTESDRRRPDCGSMATPMPGEKDLI